VVVSDRAKRADHDRCRRTHESIHIFRLPRAR
jgi:hypothetical protein